MQSSLISREMSTIPIWKIRKPQCGEVKSLALCFNTSIWWHRDWFQLWQYPNLCISTFPWQLGESFVLSIHTSLSEASWSLTPMQTCGCLEEGNCKKSHLHLEEGLCWPCFHQNGFCLPRSCCLYRLIAYKSEYIDLTKCLILWVTCFFLFSISLFNI